MGEEFKFISESECREIFSAAVENDTKHQETNRALREQNSSNFKDWNLYLRNDFNLLIHGIGSKKTLLTEFCDTYLSSLPQVVVLGYLPTLHPKKIIKNILTQVYNMKAVPARLDLQIQAIQRKPIEFVLVVHNIDGIALRTAEAQNLLSSLAALENVHLIASLDHIRAEIRMSRFIEYLV